MIEIYLNNKRADVSSDTVIGLTKEPFNIMNVPSTKITHSNSFKLPRTATNELILGFAGIPGSQSTVPYDKLTCSIIDGFVIGKGKAEITGIGDKYFSLTFYDDSSDFLSLSDNSTIGDVITGIVGAGISIGSSWAEAITAIKAGVSGFIFPSQLQYTDSSSIIFTSSEHVTLGFRKLSDIWVRAENIIDTFCSDNGYTLTNSAAIDLYFNCNLVTIRYSLLEEFNVGMSDNSSVSNTYNGYSITELIKVYAQKTNSFIDINEKNKTVKIVPFYQLYGNIDMSLNDKLASYSKKFIMSSYAKRNTVTFKPDTDVDIASYEVNFNVGNANVKGVKKHLSINSLAPKYLLYSDFDLNDYEIAAEANAIPLMAIDDTDTFSATIKMTHRATGTPVTVSVNDSLSKLKWYDSSPFYTDMETPILDKIEVFDADISLTSFDYINISVYKKYFFEELGGNFIVNKVSGYNASNNKTTKVQLIRIR